MNRPSCPKSRAAASPAHDGLTALALAAGLAFGHIVDVMVELGAAAAATVPAAIVFAAAAAGSTLCVLANLATSRDEPVLGKRLRRWITAISIGFAAALLPGLL